MPRETCVWKRVSGKNTEPGGPASPLPKNPRSRAQLEASRACSLRPISALSGSVTAFGPTPLTGIKGLREGFSAELSARPCAPARPTGGFRSLLLSAPVPLSPPSAAVRSSFSSVPKAGRPSQSPGFSPFLFAPPFSRAVQSPAALGRPPAGEQQRSAPVRRAHLAWPVPKRRSPERSLFPAG